MSVMTQERQDQAAPPAIRRPMSGIAIDPDRLTWHRESRIWSRQDLSDAVAGLDLTDENGGRLTVTRDAIAKIENGDRKPKARTVRALCQALDIGVRDLMSGGDPLVPHADAEERKLRLAHNKDLRGFARAHGIQYRNPVSGRVYYSVPLKDAFTASVAGADDETLAALVQLARETPQEDPEPETGEPARPGITEDDGIEVLDLTVRTHNTLIRTYIRTIADLTRTHAGELTGLPGFGQAALDETRGKLAAAGFALAGEEAEPEPSDRSELPVAPEPAGVLADVPHAQPVRRFAETDSIMNLQLIPRAQNRLIREGVGTIGELTRLSEDDLREIRNLGPLSQADICEKLTAAGFSLRGEGDGNRDPERLAS